MFEKKYIAANKLSRRLRASSNDQNEIYEKNINDFIDEQLNCVRVYSITVSKELKSNSLNAEYEKKSQEIAKYLIILKSSRDMNRKKLRKFKLKILKLLIWEKHLFKRANKYVSTMSNRRWEKLKRHNVTELPLKPSTFDYTSQCGFVLWQNPLCAYSVRSSYREIFYYWSWNCVMNNDIV